MIHFHVFIRLLVLEPGLEPEKKKEQKIAKIVKSEEVKVAKKVEPAAK